MVYFNPFNFFFFLVFVFIGSTLLAQVAGSQICQELHNGQGLQIKRMMDPELKKSVKPLFPFAVFKMSVLLLLFAEL